MHATPYIPGELIIFTNDARKTLFTISGSRGQQFRIVHAKGSLSSTPSHNTGQALSICIDHPKGILFSCAAMFVERP